MFEIIYRESRDIITWFDTREEAETALNHYARMDLLEELEDGEKPNWDNLGQYKWAYEIRKVM